MVVLHKEEWDLDFDLSRKGDSGLSENVKFLSRFIVLVKKLIFDKFEGVDFKYGNSLFKFRPENS